MVRDWRAPSLVCVPRERVVKVSTSVWLPRCDDGVVEWVFDEPI